MSFYLYLIFIDLFFGAQVLIAHFPPKETRKS